MADGIVDPAIGDNHGIDAFQAAFVAAADAAGIGVALVSTQLPAPRVVYISDKGVEILGHPREAILERPPTDFLSKDEQGVRDLLGGEGRKTPEPLLID